MDVELRDGTPVRLRRIQPDDKRALREGFARLSPASRYRRFFSAVRDLSEKQLAYFTEVDHRDHAAWVVAVVDPVTGTESGIGVGRYIRCADEPSAADLALAVVDDYQGRGVGTMLLEVLCHTALDNGVERFVAHVLVDNDAMLRMFRGLGATSRFESGVMAIDLPVPAAERHLAGSDLHRLLREAAARD